MESRAGEPVGSVGGISETGSELNPAGKNGRIVSQPWHHGAAGVGTVIEE